MIFFSILFNPEVNAINNIVLAKANGINSVVYLNRVADDFVLRLKELDVVILGENVNAGLGIAFNDFESYLNSTGEKKYLYFDQDTVTKDDAWKLILRTIDDAFSDSAIGAVFYGDKLDGVSSKIVVSSGCAFDLDVVNRIGFHSRDYFVEGVDYEYCLRIKNNNLKIKSIYCEDIDHKSLQDGNTFSFLGFRFGLRVYGRHRMKDFNRSHYKLMISSFEMNDFIMLLFFLKSFIVFNIREYTSRFFLRIIKCY